MNICDQPLFNSIPAIVPGKILISSNGDHYYPALYDTMIVWKDYVYGYNILTKETFQITSESGNPELPTVYGSVVVWYDFRNGNADIYGYRIPPSISQTKEVITEDKKEPRDNEGGICMGTFTLDKC